MSYTPALAKTLATDWKKATAFYARFGITEAMLRHGVPGANGRVDPHVLPAHDSNRPTNLVPA